MEDITAGLQKLAIDHILFLSNALIGAVVVAAVPPLTKIVTKYTTLLLARLTPSHENETIVGIETRHEQEKLSHAGAQETEARAERWEQDENEAHLQALRATDRAIDMQQKSLENKLRARKTEDARLAEELVDELRLATERRLVEEAQQDKERKIVEDRRAKEGRRAEAAQRAKERKRIQRTERQRIATDALETEQRRLTEIARQAQERKGIEEARQADERRLAKEAREATERRLIEVVAQDIEKQRLLDKAREMDEATKLNDQRIEIGHEITELKETMRKSEERGSAELRVGQQIGSPKEMTDPTTEISKEEFELAKQKIQFCPGQFRFAVSGVSGSGKSSLINMFLDLPDNNPDGARTGITQTTLTIGRYPDRGTEPPRKWTVWHDLPGAGTSTFSHARYFKDQCLYLFDLILVVVDNRITEIDLEIIRNCRLSKIPTFLIRSKSDVHIKNLMKSGGYESDGDNDPANTEVLRKKWREHFITKTKESMETELAKAHLPPQKVYIVSCSKQFRKEYSAFISGSEESSGEGRERFVDEMELIHDLMVAAARRCDFQRMLHTPITPASAADRALLISRLKTGQIKGIGLRIRCPCQVKRKDVEHILVKCSLTEDIRLQAQKALGIKSLTRSELLEKDEGFEWADKIWQTFLEERRGRRSTKDGREQNWVGGKKEE